ncbi:hypothetical protein KY334_07960 [Candidatus Woesearchaeota archaeon]|nr:hypothetical protein [Candidatus Woesearchaeota archaeon]
MKIHWGFWIGIGLLVIAMSALNEKLTLFIVIGVIFVTVGIVKWIFGREKNEKPKHNYVKCVLCGAWNYPHANVCHFCNKPLKRRVKSLN